MIVKKNGSGAAQGDFVVIRMINKLNREKIMDSQAITVIPIGLSVAILVPGN
jgi:hypothetical protein